MENVNALNMQWVKQVIDWSLYETSQGVDWAAIDALVETMDEAAHLLTTNAPGWAHTSRTARPPIRPRMLHLSARWRSVTPEW